MAWKNYRKTRPVYSGTGAHGSELWAAGPHGRFMAAFSALILQRPTLAKHLRSGRSGIAGCRKGVHHPTILVTSNRGFLHLLQPFHVLVSQHIDWRPEHRRYLGSCLLESVSERPVRIIGDAMVVGHQGAFGSCMFAGAGAGLVGAGFANGMAFTGVGASCPSHPAAVCPVCLLADAGLTSPRDVGVGWACCSAGCCGSAGVAVRAPAVVVAALPVASVGWGR